MQRIDYNNKLQLWFNDFCLECLTIGGKVPNAPCVFPFTHRGKTYNSCTWDVSYVTGNRPWCSTSTDVNGNHLQGRWGNCDENSDCPVPPRGKDWLLHNIRLEDATPRWFVSCRKFCCTWKGPRKKIPLRNETSFKCNASHNIKGHVCFRGSTFRNWTLSNRSTCQKTIANIRAGKHFSIVF